MGYYYDDRCRLIGSVRLTSDHPPGPKSTHPNPPEAELLNKSSMTNPAPEEVTRVWGAGGGGYVCFLEALKLFGWPSTLTPILSDPAG